MCKVGATENHGKPKALRCRLLPIWGETVIEWVAKRSQGSLKGYCRVRNRGAIKSGMLLKSGYLSGQGFGRNIGRVFQSPEEGIFSDPDDRRKVDVNIASEHVREFLSVTLDFIQLLSVVEAHSTFPFAILLFYRQYPKRA